MNSKSFLDQLLQNLAEIRPTVFYSVPRIYEKAYAKIQSRVQSAGGRKQQIFEWALKVGRSYSQHVQNNQRIPTSLARVDDRAVARLMKLIQATKRIPRAMMEKI